MADGVAARWPVLLEDGPLADEEVSRLAERIGPLRATNFGARFDVRSKPNPNNAAYTAIGLPLHTDLPTGASHRTSSCCTAWKTTPRVASRPSPMASPPPSAARAFSGSLPPAQRDTDRLSLPGRRTRHRLACPIITLDHNGQLLEIRFNNWIRDSLRLPLEQADAWYRAYREFWDLVHDPRQRLEFSLLPGQMIAFDNRRVLHGRNAFNPNSGRRHLQGTYLDLDLLESRLRVLARSA